MPRYPNYFQNLMKIEFSRLIIVRYSDIKFHDNTLSGALWFHADGWDGRMDRRTERHEEDDCRFTQFSDQAYKTATLLFY